MWLISLKQNLPSFSGAMFLGLLSVISSLFFCKVLLES